MKQPITVDSRVRLNRRPYFRGVVVALQPSLFDDHSERVLLRWHFKPGDWVGKRLWPMSVVEAIEDREAANQ